MKKIVYDIAQCVAVSLISAGVWDQFGWSIALIVLGVLVLALSFVDAILLGARR
jgi:hypothetical protein